MRKNRIKPDIYAPNGVAIGGYDPVSYFLDHQAAVGSSAYRTHWGGAEWHFVNADHKNMFDKSPESYAPQYGGYCSFGVGLGDKAHSSPKAWSIVDGKLYLNQTTAVNKIWRATRFLMVPAAEHNWPKLIQAKKTDQ